MVFFHGPFLLSPIFFPVSTCPGLQLRNPHLSSLTSALLFRRPSFSLEYRINLYKREATFLRRPFFPFPDVRFYYFPELARFIDGNGAAKTLSFSRKCAPAELLTLSRHTIFLIMASLPPIRRACDLLPGWTIFFFFSINAKSSWVFEWSSTGPGV